MNADTLDPATLQALLLLASLGAMACYNRYQTRQAEREHPPSGRFVSVDGVRLHYLEQGRGTPVVLLHGNALSAEDYVLSGVFERLAKTHRVVAFDRPGYGYSERPPGGLWSAGRQAALLSRALGQLGVEHPLVVGHAWGTLVALEMALAPAADVAGLVLLAGQYRASARLEVLAAAPPAIPLLGDALRHTLSPLLNRALVPLGFKVMFAPLPVPERFRQQFPYRFPLRPLQIRAEAQDALTLIPALLRLRGRYRLLRQPLTILAGSEDLLANAAEQARWLHAGLPGSHLQLVPGAGHMLHHAAPGQVAAAVERVAAEARPRTDATTAENPRPARR